MRSELDRKGITEDELKLKLLEKGVTVDNLTPEKALQLKFLIEQAVHEIEVEKRNSTVHSSRPKSIEPTSLAKPLAKEQKVEPQLVLDKEASKEEVRKLASKSSKDIAQKIKEGATVEEAVAESLQKVTANASVRKHSVYGQELFKNKTLDVYRTTKDARPPDNYLLGTGDEISVIIFGASQGDFRYEINEEGYISPQGMGKIFLRGVPYGKAKEILKARFSRNFIFREDQFVMHLATARTVSVNIFGEVENPGTFSMSSINTAFNSLVAAGGPTEIGSIRNVKLIRAGKVKDLDVYAFMKNPNLQYEYYLQDNDILHIPVAEKLVTIEGAVLRPHVYELKSGESLKHLIDYAGGLSPFAYRKSVQVARVLGQKNIIQEIDLDSDLGFELQNGDHVFIREITNPATNTVVVDGEVEFPGVFATQDLTDLASLLFKTIPKPTARLDLAMLFRKDSLSKVQILPVSLKKVMQGEGEPIPLRSEDRLLVFKQSTFVDSASVSISGAVREPNTFAYGVSSTLADYLNLSGGLRDDAHDVGYIIRTNLSDRSKEYIRIEPRTALTFPKSESNPKLQALDEVRVLSKKDFRDSAYVRVTGAVNKPISLPYGSGISLLDALNLSGGLRLESKKGRIDVFSLDLNDRYKTRALQNTIEITDADELPALELKPYDEIVVRSVPEFSMLKKVNITGEVRYPGEYAILKENERISDMIKKAGGLTSKAYSVGGRLVRNNSTGYHVVATKMHVAIKKPGSYADLVLHDGDQINIPQSLDFVDISIENTHAVDVLGPEVSNGAGKVAAAFKAGKRGSWYIREYVGGVGKYSNFKQMRIHYPNGRIKRARNLGVFTITPKPTPGALIVLATDESKTREKSREPKKPIDWDKALTQTLTFLSAAATVVLAVTAINK